MGKIKSIFLNIKSNWKGILFAIVYVICFWIIIVFSFGINDYVNGVKVISPLLLCLSLFSVLALLAKIIVEKLFKDNANQVIKKSSLIFIPVGFIMSFWMLIYIIANEATLISRSNALFELLSTFLFAILIIWSVIFGLLAILLNILAFALLRFVIKYEKVVIIISLVSIVIWLVTLGKNT